MTATIVNELAKPAFIKEFAQDVSVTLSTKPKFLKPKYFYDHKGSELFEEICRQPEYYPTRTEASILERHSSDIADIYAIDSCSIIELGSGSSSKTRMLLQSFVGTKYNKSYRYYFPIDISHSMLKYSAKILSEQFPTLNVIGLPTDYLDGINKVNQFIVNKNIDSARKIIVFLGSSIGNFERNEAETFLKVLADKMNTKDSLLVGFDLHKNVKILNAAYNDSAGITSKFNMNILHRINKELGGEFDTGLFKHHAFYNKQEKRIEMHLISTCKQQVYIKEIDKIIDFEVGESIHTENSYKYTLPEIHALASKCSLNVKRHFSDNNHWFDLALFEKAI
jgi:L-histidine Nalpha-methyltransferase